MVHPDRFLERHVHLVDAVAAHAQIDHVQAPIFGLQQIRPRLFIVGVDAERERVSNHQHRVLRGIRRVRAQRPIASFIGGVPEPIDDLVGVWRHGPAPRRMGPMESTRYQRAVPVHHLQEAVFPRPLGFQASDPGRESGTKRAVISVIATVISAMMATVPKPRRDRVIKARAVAPSDISNDVSRTSAAIASRPVVEIKQGTVGARFDRHPRQSDHGPSGAAAAGARPHCSSSPLWLRKLEIRVSGPGP